MPKAHSERSERSQQAQPWVDALHDCTDTAFEYCRDVIDVRSPADLLDVNAYYASRQQKWLVGQWNAANQALTQSWLAWINGELAGSPSSPLF